MALQELQIYGLWAGKQTAKGTKNAAPGKRFKQVAGAFNFTRDDGSENYSDATQYPDTQDWVNSLVGNGNPGVEATPEELAWLFWAFEGGETTRRSSARRRRRSTRHAAAGLGHWSTWATRQGSSLVDRLSHNDCQISQIQVEGGPGRRPSARRRPCCRSTRRADRRRPRRGDADEVDVPLHGRHRPVHIDGTVVRGHSAFTLVVNKDLQPVYADDVTVHDLAIGNARSRSA
jgi:hypothetical protein